MRKCRGFGKTVGFLVLFLVGGMLVGEYLKPEPPSHHHNRAIKLPGPPPPTPKIIRAIEVLMQTGIGHGLEVRLLEPSILSAHQTNQKLSLGSCQYLCHPKYPLVFAVFGKQLVQKPHFLAALEERGFKTTVYRDAGGRRVALVALEWEDQHYLYILVLYDQETADYLRQYSPAVPPAGQDQVASYIPQTWRLLKVDRAYGLFRTHMVKIDGLFLELPTNISAFLLDSANSTFLPCTDARVYKKELTGTELEQKTYKLNLLFNIKSILDTFKTPFWLTGPTLLGYAQRCDVLPNTKAVDIGIYIEDYQSKFVHKFLSRGGLKLTHKLGRVQDSLQLTFKDRHAQLNVFFFYHERDSMWHGRTDHKTGLKLKYTLPAITLCWSEFLGLKMRIPCKTENYIEAHFGPHWSHVNSKWNWKNAPNAQSNGKWLRKEWRQVNVHRELGIKVKVV